MNLNVKILKSLGVPEEQANKYSKATLTLTSGECPILELMMPVSSLFEGDIFRAKIVEIKDDHVA